MKNLKITVLAVMLLSAAAVYANPTTEATKLAEARIELYKDLKRNLTKFSVVNAMADDQSQAEFTVYGFVNAQGNFQIINIQGDGDKMKNRIIKITEEHTIQAPSALMGSNFSFKLKLIQQ